MGTEFIELIKWGAGNFLPVVRVIFRTNCWSLWLKRRQVGLVVQRTFQRLMIEITVNGREDFPERALQYVLLRLSNR